MQITLQQIGRRFNREWIFRGIDFDFMPGGKYAVLGPNGAGKSTLLNILSGSLTPSEGNLRFFHGKEIAIEDLFREVSFAAPYIDLVEEFTLRETIDFHFRFKRFNAGMDAEAVMELLNLPKSADKALKFFSSGMKQRTKLALACCADTAMLILDEPTSNLDSQGVDWYHALIEKHAVGKTVIVGSNQVHEYVFCTENVEITRYK